MTNWEKFSGTAKKRWSWLRIIACDCYNFDFVFDTSWCRVKLNYFKKYSKSCLLDLNISFGIMNLVHQVFINEIAIEERKVVCSLIFQLFWKQFFCKKKRNVSFSRKSRFLCLSQSQYFLLLFFKIRTWSMALVVRLVVTQDCRERHDSRRCTEC